MKHRPWLRYVHWFGYVASVIVILQLLFLGYLGAQEWKRHEERREQTRMQQGPAKDRLNGIYADDTEIALLGKLPPSSSLDPDGLRLVAMPSFGDTNFAIWLRRTSQGGEGVMLMAPSLGDSGSVETIPLKLSTAAYNELTVRLDALASSWNGESRSWGDGTSIVFERVRNKSVTSGSGNSPRFYGEVGALIFEAIRQTTPRLARFDNSWHPRDR